MMPLLLCKIVEQHRNDRFSFATLRNIFLFVYAQLRKLLDGSDEDDSNDDFPLNIRTAQKSSQSWG